MRYAIFTAEDAYSKGVSRFGHRSKDGRIIVSEKEAAVHGLGQARWYTTDEIKRKIKKENWK